MTIPNFKNVKCMTILFVTILFLTSCSNQSENSKEVSFAGMYKLLIMEIQDSTGVWYEDSWAKGGESYIIYDGLGHMAVQITPEGYKDFKWLGELESINQNFVKQKVDSMSLEDLKAAVMNFSSNYVYVADYSVNDTANIITHKRISSSIPSVWGTEVKRAFTFSGDTLILSVENSSVLKVLNVNRRLKWVRQKDDNY
uniref:lipocalin-like domain-containing protein n=1 Tax=Algoriphagus sp. TaxID=1872435 RepID=UPI004048118B